MSDKSKKRNIIRPHQYTTIQYMTGPSRKDPKRRIHCHKFFQKGESLKRVTSPPDPKYGTYAFGINATCMS